MALSLWTRSHTCALAVARTQRGQRRGAAHPSLEGHGAPGGCDRDQISCHVRRRDGVLLLQLFAPLRTGRFCSAGIRSRFVRFQGSCGCLLGCWGRLLGDSGLLLGVAGALCRRGSTACLRRGVCRCS